MKKTDNFGIILLLFGIGDFVNAFWMLASPMHWYLNLPASVPDFGPMNEHFIRDLGAMFLVFGAILIWSALKPGMRKFALGTNFAWYSVHSIVHLFDTFRGLVAMEHLLIDLPLVYIPTCILAVLLFVWNRQPEDE